LIARAQATSAAVAQGASEGSGLQGGLSQVTGQAASNIQGINQGQDLGNQMFAANSMISTGQTYQSIGGGISGLGQSITNNYDMLSRRFPSFA
jgi:hypothetical protein